MIDYYLAWGVDGGESDFSKMEAHWQPKTSPCLEHNLRREKGGPSLAEKAIGGDGGKSGGLETLV